MPVAPFERLVRCVGKFSPFVYLAPIIYTTAYRFYSVGINFAFCLFGCVIIW